MRLPHLAPLLAFLALSCARITPPMTTAVEQPETVRLSIEALDPTLSKKWVFTMRLHNLSEASQIVLLHDLHCFRGDVEGELAFRVFGIGERTMDLHPGEQKTFDFDCQFSETPMPRDGPYRLVVAKVFSNPSGDGSSPGPVIARDLAWAYEPTK